MVIRKDIQGVIVPKARVWAVVIGVAAWTLSGCGGDFLGRASVADAAAEGEPAAESAIRIGPIGLYRDMIDGQMVLLVGNNDPDSAHEAVVESPDGVRQTITLPPMGAVVLNITAARLVTVN